MESIPYHSVGTKEEAKKCLFRTFASFRCSHSDSQAFEGLPNLCPKLKVGMLVCKEMDCISQSWLDVLAMIKDQESLV